MTAQVTEVMSFDGFMDKMPVLPEVKRVNDVAFVSVFSGEEYVGEGIVPLRHFKLDSTDDVKLEIVDLDSEIPEGKNLKVRFDLYMFARESREATHLSRSIISQPQVIGKNELLCSKDKIKTTIYEGDLF